MAGIAELYQLLVPLVHYIQKIVKASGYPSSVVEYW